MRIGVNLLALVPNRIGGLEHYVRRLLEKLVDHTNHVFVLMAPPAAAASFAQVPDRLCVRQVIDESDPAVARAISESAVDLWWCPWVDWRPFLPRVPTVVTIPDLQHEHFRENFPPVELVQRRQSYFLAAHLANEVITFSRHTRDDLLQLYGLSGERIHAIPLDVGYDWAGSEPSRELVADLEREHGTGFLYYPANTWPHKDHELLLRAFKTVADRGHVYRLVLTGAGDYDRARVENRIRALGLENQVRLLGTMPPAVVRGLYRLSGALVFPSRFEGFGMPILEAMRAGTPVLCSDATSLPEVGGDAVLYFPAGDLERLSLGIVRMMEDADLRTRCVERGMQRAALFSWEKTARATAEIFDLALRSPRPDTPAVAALEGLSARLAASEADRAARLDLIVRMRERMQLVHVILSRMRGISGLIRTQRLVREGLVLLKDFVS